MMELDHDSGKFTLKNPSINRLQLMEAVGNVGVRRDGALSFPDTEWSYKGLMRIAKPTLTPRAEARINQINLRNERLTPLVSKVRDIKTEKVDTEGFVFKGKHRPHDHQLKMWWSAVNVLKVPNTGFFFFCGVGTGKSMAAINTAVALKQQGLVNRVLVVTPASLKFNFGEQVQIHSEETCNILVSCKKKSDGSRKWLWTEEGVDVIEYYSGYKGYTESPNGFFHIINYESAVIGVDLFSSGYDLLIADEAHYLKSRTSARTKAVKVIAENCPMRLGMTGTPISSSPLDMWSIFDVMEPGFLHNRYIDFENRVAVMQNIKLRSGQSFNKVVGWKDEGMKWLNETIYQRAIRYQTEECLDLPEKTFKQIFVETPAGVLKLYNELKTELVATVEDQTIMSPNSLAVVSKLRQISSGFVKVEGGYKLVSDFKLQAAMELLDIFEGKQVILWYWHSFIKNELVERIQKKFKEMPIVIDGKATATEKAQRIHQFQNGETRFAVWNIAVSEGNTATAASVAIYVENSFTYKDRHQSEGRICRQGQKQNMVFVDLCSQGTLDLRILKAVSNKEDLSEKTLSEEFKRDRYKK